MPVNNNNINGIILIPYQNIYNTFLDIEDIFINSLICLYRSSYNITLMYNINHFNHENIVLIIHVFHNVQSRCGSDILIHLSYIHAR